MICCCMLCSRAATVVATHSSSLGMRVLPGVLRVLACYVLGRVAYEVPFIRKNKIIMILALDPCYARSQSIILQIIALAVNFTWPQQTQTLARISA
jgi:hypothetical protein